MSILGKSIEAFKPSCTAVTSHCVLQIRAFVRNLEGTAKQELNQSPLPFIESKSEPGITLQRYHDWSIPENSSLPCLQLL